MKCTRLVLLEPPDCNNMLRALRRDSSPTTAYGTILLFVLQQSRVVQNLGLCSFLRSVLSFTLETTLNQISLLRKKYIYINTFLCFILETHVEAENPPQIRTLWSPPICCRTSCFSRLHIKTVPLFRFMDIYITVKKKKKGFQLLY